MNLKNIKKGIITTIFGVLFLIADLFYLIYPMFIEKDYETNSLVLLAVGTIGLGLLLSPDDLFGLLKNKMNDKL